MNTDNVIRVLIVAALAGVFMGLTAGRLFWKKDHQTHEWLTWTNTDITLEQWIANTPTNSP